MTSHWSSIVTVTSSTIMKETYTFDYDQLNFGKRKNEVFQKNTEEPMKTSSKHISRCEKPVLVETHSSQSSNKNLQESKWDSKETSRESLNFSVFPQTTLGEAMNPRFSQIQTTSPATVQKICISGPLPYYITKVEKPVERILKRSLYCDTCGVYVNSENQMKQHISSLRHQNVLQGIPIPPKPDREEKLKVRAQQYHCSICKLMLNSEIQLTQHLLSQRHKNMLEGKPPKPRWSPYEKTGQARLQITPRLQFPHNVISNQSFPASSFPPPPAAAAAAAGHLPNTNAIPGMNAFLSTPRHLSLCLNSAPSTAHLKLAPFVLQDTSLPHNGEIVYFSVPPLQSLPVGATCCSSMPGLHNLPVHQQQMSCNTSFQHILKM